MGPRALVVIPARLGAQRLPNKPIRLLAGKPLVAHVVANAVASGVSDRVVVATDSPSVAEAVNGSKCEVVMTGAHHPSGTSRVAEVAARLEYAAYDIVVNVQGDEPFLPHAAIRGAVEQVVAGFDVGTAAVPVDEEAVARPSLVKVAMGEGNRALYFSRSPIPFNRSGTPGRYWQHLGVYAYRPATLARWMELPRSPLEDAEKLEQLTPLANGLTFGVALLSDPAMPGIDTEEDLERAEAWMASRGATFSG
ncbi:MAG: 3-deoxy-manno-octulosonate cytidylyltransferase [Gemmatimonadales bacterium]|nr:3-deoxy-manno-octulosonate cytidylyltransferase [Gemmatimonadales bacterium]